MNPQQFLNIISQGKNLQKEDFQQLMKLHETFPFFQIPKLLLAKYEYTKTSGNIKEFLHWAAVSSPDRVWLKSFLEGDEISEGILQNLQDKLDLKKKNKKTKKVSPPESDEEILDEKLIPDPAAEIDPQKRAGILRKLGEELHQHKHAKTQQPNSGVELPKEKKKIRKEEGNDLIENIKKKAKKEILDEKKKEQIDLIKAFNKREFKLATLKEMENFHKQDDLSKSSTQLNPSLVSESYAKLLLNQGKKGKAKEIYQKLMVNFPDKSSYFAELLKEIEDKK